MADGCVNLSLTCSTQFDLLSAMSDSSISQQISLEIIRDPSRACLTNHLDFLELEDSSLSQLHPLARVIALSERGRVSSVTKKILQEATKAITLSGIHEICTEEKSDDWNLTYYKIVRRRRGSYALNCLTEPVNQKIVKVEFQLGCEMNGGSMDGFTATKSRVSISPKDLALVKDEINEYGKEKKMLERLLSAKAKACSSLDPGLDNLDGGVEIYLESVTLWIDDHILKMLDLPNIPVADLQYSVGELIESSIHVPVDESSEFSGRCFWPKWLPLVAEELTTQLKNYYSDHLSSDTDPGVIEQIQLAASSIDEGCQRPQNGGLYIDLNKLLEMEIFTAPLFRDACFNISSKKHLPPNFKASEHIGFEGLAKILLKIRDIAACIDGH